MSCDEYTQKIKELEEIVERITIESKFYKNEYAVSKREFENASHNYLTILSESQLKNEELQRLKSITESINKQLADEVKRANEMAKLADSANSAKNMFLANIGHEFRTPLNSIIGLADILVSQTDMSQEEIRKHLVTIHKRTGDLLRLVNDLLDISKIEAGKLSLICVNFKLKELIRDINRIYIPQTKRKKIKYKVHVDKKINKFLSADRLRIQQVLINLISNSLKFTDSGTIAVAVNKIRESNKNGQIELEFSVSDTGIGIPKHKQHLLFKPFSQIQDGSSSFVGGTGLGLAISKKLVEMMGGKIWVEDNTPRGIRFCFNITVDIGEEKIYAETFNPDTAGNILEKLEQITILIAEDDEPSATVLKIVLKQKNKKIQTIWASDGQEAIKAYRSQKVDIIMTDILMPNMDGIDMMNQIRAFEKSTNQHIPIIAMTAFSMPEDRERCLNAGADIYIPKPLVKNDILQAVDKAIILTGKNPPFVEPVAPPSIT